MAANSMARVVFSRTIRATGLRSLVRFSSDAAYVADRPPVEGTVYVWRRSSKAVHGSVGAA